jgi:hypothetical protein
VANNKQVTAIAYRVEPFGLSLRNPRHLEHGLRILSTPNPATSQSHSFTIVQTSFLQIGKFGSALFAQPRRQQNIGHRGNRAGSVCIEP